MARQTTTEFSWETNLGDATARTAEAGRRVILFRQKLEVDGDDVEMVRRAAEVAEMGRSSMRLVMPTGAKVASPRGSDSDSDDPEWDTSGWSDPELHASLESLLATVERSHQKKRRTVATAMVLTLLKRHSAARSHMELLLTSLTDKGLFFSTTRERSEEQRRLGHLLGAVAPTMPGKLSRLGAVSKSVRLLSYKHHLAARLLQHIWRSRRFERKQAALQPVHVRLRTRAMFILTLNDLRRSWEAVHLRTVLSPDETLSQLRLLVALTNDGVSPNVSKDRTTALRCGVLSAVLSLCTHAAQDLRTGACNLLLNLVREPSLRLEMLRAGTHLWLINLLRSDLLDDRLRALDTLDLLLESCCPPPGDVETADAVWRELCAEASKDSPHAEEKEAKDSTGKQDAESQSSFVEAEGASSSQAFGLDLLPSEDEVKSRELMAAVEATFRRVVCDNTRAMRDLTPDIFGFRSYGKAKTAKLPRYMRDRQPKFRLKDAAALVCSTGHGGGILRWLRWILNSDDLRSRIGACMVLSKVASGPCNHAVLGLPLPCFNAAAEAENRLTLEDGEAITPPLAPYPERLSWRVRRFAVPIVECLAFSDVPTLPAAALQLFSQASATLRGRTALEAAGAPELLLPLCMRTAAKAQAASIVRNAVQGFDLALDAKLEAARKEEMKLLVRGLLCLVALASNHSRPFPLSDAGVAGIELDASPLELTDLLHERLLLLIGQRQAESSLERLAQYGAVAPIVTFLLASAAEADGSFAPPFKRPVLELREGQPIMCEPAISEELPAYVDVDRERDHRSVSALVLARFCEVANLRAMLCVPRVFAHLTKLICLERAAMDDDVSQGLCTGQLHRAAIDSCCRALASLARCSPSIGVVGVRGDVAAVLTEGGALPDLVHFATRASEISSGSEDLSTLHALDVKAGVSAVALLGAVVPWLGFEMDTASDMMEVAGSRSYSGRHLDNHSRLPPVQKRALGRIVAQTASPLLDALTRTESASLRSVLCYTLARYSCTRRFAASLLGLGAVEVALELIPPPPRLLQRSGSAEEGGNGTVVAMDDIRRSVERKVERQLRLLPATLFTLLASLSRVDEVRRRIWRSGLLSRALERLVMDSDVHDLKNMSHDIKTRGEIALLLARTANTHEPQWGSANEQIVRSTAIGELVKLTYAGEPDPGAAKPPSAEGTNGHVPEWSIRAQHNALLALAQLSEDPLLVVPPIVNSGAVGLLIRHVAKENALTASRAPLTRQALRVLCAIAKYPLAKYHQALIAANVAPTLHRIGGDYQLELRDRNNKSGQLGLGELARSVLSKLQQTQEGKVNGDAAPGSDAADLFRPPTAGLREIQEGESMTEAFQISPWRGGNEPLFQLDFGLGSRVGSGGRVRSRGRSRGNRRRSRRRRGRVSSTLDAAFADGESRPSTTPVKLGGALNTIPPQPMKTSVNGSDDLLWTRPPGVRPGTKSNSRNRRRPVAESQRGINSATGRPRTVPAPPLRPLTSDAYRGRPMLLDPVFNTGPTTPISRESFSRDGKLEEATTLRVRTRSRGKRRIKSVSNSVLFGGRHEVNVLLS